MGNRTLLVSTLLVAVAAVAWAQTPDFNGIWELDEEASQINTLDGLTGFNDHAPLRLYITQSRDGKLILATREPGAQPRNYLFGGETWLPAPDDPNQKMMMSSRVRGLSLVSQGHTRVAGETISIQEVLSINPNGRSLTLRVTTSRNGEAETNLLVYTRAR
jgi:hypothetical protein